MTLGPVVPIAVPTTTSAELLIIGDGFTELETHRFAEIAFGVASAIHRQPWFNRAPRLGIWAVQSFPTSADPLVAPPSCPIPFLITARTTLGAYYDGGSGACHFLGGADWAVTGLKSQIETTNMSAGFLFDSVLVVVNSPYFGGSGGGTTAWSSASPGLATKIAVHELGHTFGLADEYEGPCGVAAAGVGPVYYPNVTADPANPPWRRWLGTPPQPPVLKANPTDCDAPSPFAPAVIGVFEGGDSKHTGFFRPSHRCKMRNLNDAYLCAVCDMFMADALDATLPNAVEFP